MVIQLASLIAHTSTGLKVVWLTCVICHTFDSALCIIIYLTCIKSVTSQGKIYQNKVGELKAHVIDVLRCKIHCSNTFLCPENSILVPRASILLVSGGDRSPPLTKRIEALGTRMREFQPANGWVDFSVRVTHWNGQLQHTDMKPLMTRASFGMARSKSMNLLLNLATNL